MYKPALLLAAARRLSDSVFRQVLRGRTRRSVAPLIAVLAGAAVALYSPLAQAQVQRSFLNTGFEEPALAPDNCYLFLTDDQVPGWETTHSIGDLSAGSNGTCTSPIANPIGRFIELWRTYLVAPREGLQTAELNALENSRLYQNVCLTNGETIDWRFSHRGLNSATVPDVMEMMIGNAPVVRVATTNAGGGTIQTQYQGTASAADFSGWGDYAGSFTYSGATGMTSIGFEAISTSNGVPGNGNELDALQIELDPYVEFSVPSSAGAEGDSSGIPGIRISGNVAAPLSVAVTTGGTATLGVEYTTPSGTAAFTIMIPAGNYAGEVFPLGVQILDDGDAGGDETITFDIVPNPTSYVVASTAVCGDPAIATTTHTIESNEIATDLAITKSDGATTYTPGLDTTYTIVATNNGPADTVGARIVDPLPLGITNASWTCGNATGGGICSVPSGTGGINTTADLPVGASVTYTLFMSVPASFNGNLTNTATIEVPAGMTDSDPANNSASDTNTREVPPVSGACAPRAVALGSTFSLAPFAVTGSVTKTGSWNTAPDPWTTTGGNYSITWNFSQPVPAYWLQVAVLDVNPESPSASITMSLGAGSTASVSDFEVVLGDLNYSAGTLTRSGAVAGKQGAALQARNTTNTITSITITGSNIVAGDSIMNRIYVRPPCLTVSKVSTDGTGSFQIDMSNVGNASGASIASTTLTTTTAGMAVSSPQYFGRDTRNDLVLSEVVPSGWNAASAVCTDQNAGTTGNPTVIGSFAAPAITIPAANVRPEADIRCLFTNEQAQGADLSITKDDGATIFTRGSNVTYTIVASNNGPMDVTGAAISDPLPSGITTANWTCGSATNGAVCGAPSGTGAISTTADLPVGSSLTYTLTLTVPAGYTGVQLTNTATVTAPAGLTDPDTSNNTASDTNAVSPAQPSFGSCTPTVYLSVGSPTQLVRADTSTNPFSYPTIGTPYAAGYNAMAYDHTSNYLYAMQPNPTANNRLLRIGSNGSVVDLGDITGGGINVEGGGFATGEIGTDGFFYVKRNAATSEMYRIDLTTRLATRIGLSQAINTADFAWYNGLIYTHDNTNDTVYSINPNTGAVTAVGLAGLTNNQFGSLVSASNGIFGRENTTGGFYQFDPVTGAATLISSGPAGAGDGAKCVLSPLQFPADTRITKTDNSIVYSPGTDVTYTIVVTNDGPFGVQGVTVDDPLPAGISLANWTCVGAGGGVCGAPSGTGGISTTANLPVGGTVTYTHTLTVPADFTGDLVNTATATNPPDSPDPDPSTNTSTDTNVPGAPALTIEKTGTLNDLDGDGLIDLGETISYSFRVTNTGDVAMTDVTVNDPLLTNAGISVSPGPQTLAPGGTATFTATYTPTQAEIDAGQVVNTATGRGTDPSGGTTESPPDTETVPPDQTPALTIEKTGVLNDLDGDGLIDLGETITYSFLVTNSGTVTMTGVTVDDPLLTNAGVSVSPGPQTLGPGGTATFTATYTPIQADIDAGSVENVAAGTGTPPSGPPITSPPDDVTVPPDQTPGLIIEKTGTLNDLDGDGLIDLGETIAYSFLVTNTGTVTVTNVTVDDPLLAGAGVSVSPGPQTLAPGASATFTATYTPTQAEIDAGRVENTATGTGTPPSGPPITSPPDTVVVPPDQTPALTIEKTGTLNDADGDGLIDLGETISYSFLVRNTGAVTLTGVTIDDPLLTNAGLSVTPGPQTLAPGGSVTFTATYTPTQADIDAGQVENTATGTGTPPSGPPITSPPDTVVVPPDQTPALTIEKTGTLNDLDGDGLLDLGETISYSFLVRNTGAVTMTNVTVNDPLLTNAGVSVTPGPLTLGPGGSATFTATYTPTQADIDAGRVENTATGTGTPPSGPPTESPPDTVVVPPDQASGLTIVKTGTLNDLDGDGFIDLGETIGYSFLVTNTGAVTLTNVTVNDPLLANAGVSVTPGPQTLAPGANVTFTATYTPTQADIDAGRVENTATGTGTPPSGPPTESPPDTVVVPPDQTAGLTIEKTGTLNDLDGGGLLDPGETISYSFLATNTGAVTLSDVTINDPLLAGAGVSVTPGPQTLAPGATVTFTAVYAPTQAQIDAGVVENVATGTGTDPGGGTIESPPDSVTVPPQPASLDLVKTGRFDDVDGNGSASVGDTLTYTFTVINDGGQTAADVWPKDPGPSFGGQPATGALSPFTPSPITLAPGQQAVFTATYTLTEADVTNAAGAPDSVANTATAVGYVNGNVITGTPVESEESRSLVTLPAAASDISVSKVALLRHIRRGEEAPFAITITNNSASAAQGLTVIDTLPSGFRYVDGSASVNGVAATPVVEGRQVIFSNVAVPANSAVEIRLRMLALSSAGPGEHVNRASVTDASGNPLAPDATATVEILAEPVFDCGDVIGKVFDDRNRNGYQDEGEPGLPGVRIATVDGWLVTTDAHGRFHVPCAMLPDQRIGSNFIMKLDTRTLPTGYRVTTENPRVVRLTAGKMTELNFGAAIGRVVRLDLQDAAFVPGELELRPEWVRGLDQLMAVLAQEQSVLRLTYIEAGADPDFAGERLKHLGELIGDRWRQTSGQYRLEIEMRVETGE